VEWKIGKLFSQTTDSMRHNGGRDRKQRKRVSTYYNSVKKNYKLFLQKMSKKKNTINYFFKKKQSSKVNYLVEIFVNYFFLSRTQ
jgi:hypothetical protein